MVSSTYKDKCRLASLPGYVAPLFLIMHNMYCVVVLRDIQETWFMWIVHPNKIGFRWFEMIISIELCVSL